MVVNRVHAFVSIPANVTLAETAAMLEKVSGGLQFEQEFDRFDEVPAFVAQGTDVEFVLFGIPEDEVGEMYDFYFILRSDNALEVIAKNFPYFGRDFMPAKAMHPRGAFDFSPEFAQRLRSMGIAAVSASPFGANSL